MGALDQAQAGGGAVTPDLAAAAAQAGAPPAGAEAGGGAPPPQAAGPVPQPMPGPAGGAPPPAAGTAPPGAPPPGAEPRPEQGAGAEAQPQGGGAKAGPAGAIEPYLTDATPRQQKEYERAIRAMAKVLYGNDKTANSIVDQIRPDDLVGTTVKVTALFLKELDRAINMDVAVVSEVTRESVERIAELAEARHQTTYSTQDMERVLGATWETVQSMWGNEGGVEEYNEVVSGIAPNDLDALQQQNRQILSGANAK